MSTMRAVVIRAPGGPEVLKMETLPIPRPKEGEVLIKVMAAGVNRSEMFTRQGHSPDVKFPRVLGIEAAGTVEACPDGTFAPGSTVFTCMSGLGRAHDGGYAEYTLVQTGAVRAVGPTTLGWDVLGSLPEMVQTTWGSLFEALAIEKGDRLLVRGGTSSIGLCAITLAKEAGCYVAATSRSAHSKDQILSAGADDFILDDGNIAARLAPNEKYTKVLELIGPITLADSLRCCAPRSPGSAVLGRVCQTGIAGGKWIMDSFDPMVLIPPGVCLTKYSGGGAEFQRTPFEEIIKKVEDGKLQFPVGKTFGLEEAHKAHEIMEMGGAGGKMVLLMHQ